MKSAVVLAASSLLVLSACTTMDAQNVSEEQSDGYPTSGVSALQRVATQDLHPVGTTKAERTNRHTTVAWDNIGLAGAATHQPAYVDVLDVRGMNFSYQGDPIPSTKPATVVPIDPMPAPQTAAPKPQTKQQATSKGRSYAIYEHARWKRFCSNGYGMNEADWKFVTTEGSNPPKGLMAKCSPPSYDIDAYLNAWKVACSGAEISGAQQKIVSTTKTPSSIKRCTQK